MNWIELLTDRDNLSKYRPRPRKQLCLIFEKIFFSVPISYLG